MIVRYLLAALVAGLIAGALQTVVQQSFVVPLILEAEKYEGGAPPMQHDNMSSAPFSIVGEAQAQEATPPADAAAAEEEEDNMLFGVSRTTGTLMANLVTGAGFALIMMAAGLLTGRQISLKTGALWGVISWLAFQLLPAVGLPPGLPGVPAAEIGARQFWWASTIVMNAAGFYLLILRGEVWAKVVGVVLLAVPHIIGAPQLAEVITAVPANVAVRYAVRALAAGLFFWIAIGLILGSINDRWLKNA
ncbi:CbtA family protein [Rhizobium sp.]